MGANKYWHMTKKYICLLFKFESVKRCNIFKVLTPNHEAGLAPVWHRFGAGLALVMLGLAPVLHRPGASSTTSRSEIRAQLSG